MEGEKGGGEAVIGVSSTAADHNDMTKLGRQLKDGFRHFCGCVNCRSTAAHHKVAEQQKAEEPNIVQVQDKEYALEAMAMRGPKRPGVWGGPSPQIS